MPDTNRIDKTIIRKGNIKEQGNDFLFWQSQPFELRLSTVEEIRVEYNTFKYGFNKDFNEFIALLNANDVKYLIVGGYAVGFHGYPRYTKDLDIWILISHKNAENLLSTIEQFGFGSLGLLKDDFLKPDKFVQLGYPPNRIDILMSCDGVTFETCYQTKKQIVINGLKMDFIDIENLKKNKKATARPQDLADLDNLEAK